jgi:hypothetical protein
MGRRDTGNSRTIGRCVLRGIVRELALEPTPKNLRRHQGSPQTATSQKEEPKELDSDNEAVAHMHEGIRRILSKARPKPDASLVVPEDEKHTLHCSRILKLEIERKTVNIIVMKSDGGLRQVRIEASSD